jgi:hypothetical protein
MFFNHRTNAARCFFIFAATFLFCIAISHVVQADDSRVPNNSHLLLQISFDKGVFKIEKVTIVEHALPKRRNTRRTYPWRVEVSDKNSNVTYKADFNDPTILRGEFVNEDDPSIIDSHTFVRKHPTRFAIRVPLLVRGARISFSKLKSTKRHDSNPTKEDFEIVGLVKYQGLLKTQRDNKPG